MTALDERPATDDRSPRPLGQQSVDVCLVSMPYANLSLPSMGLGLLAAILGEHGISTRAVHANLRFAERVGLLRYQICAAGVPTDLLIGEWTFREAAFGPAGPQADAEFLDRAAQRIARSLPPTHEKVRAVIDEFRALHEAAAQFVDDIAHEVVATGARVVGCTSTFEQHVASLALLRRVRELAPDVITMLGGANCETDMGRATHANFEWVDYVVSGEADGLIGPFMADVLRAGRDIALPDLPSGVRGPAHRRALPLAGGPAANLPRALFRDLDRLPCPDYRDYFSDLAASSLYRHVRPGVPVETSRGCWWGVKHQCTFCGLNGSSLTYNSKSADKVLAELRELERRHGVHDFEVVDNILDSRYFTTLLPELSSEDEPDRSLFFEVKANLSRRHIEQLVAAGVTWVQPGIESLDSDVLRIMDKGIQGWQNIQLLKWAGELGLRLSWSLLWGFPGETDESYRRIARFVPLLEHLQPPAAIAKLRYDRYSVYYNEPERYGLRLRPVPAMRHIYPVPEADLADLAYFFVSDTHSGPGDDPDAPRPGVDTVQEQLVTWRASFAKNRAVLTAEDDGQRLVVTDTRACAIDERTVLTGLERAVAVASAEGVRADRVAERIRETHDPAATDAQVQAAVEQLLGRNVVLAIDGRLLGLALAPDAAPLPDLTDFPGGRVSVPPLVDRPAPAGGPRAGAEPIGAVPAEPRPTHSSSRMPV